MIGWVIVAGLLRFVVAAIKGPFSPGAGGSGGGGTGGGGGGFVPPFADTPGDPVDQPPAPPPYSLIPKHKPPKAPRKPIAKGRGKTKHNQPTPHGPPRFHLSPGPLPPAPEKPKPPPPVPAWVNKADKPPPDPHEIYGDPNIFPEHNLRYPPRFRFMVIRGDSTDTPSHEVTNVVNCSWDDVSAVMTGQIQLVEPMISTPDPFVSVSEGDRISCQVDVHDGQGFRQLWIMRTKSESYQLESGYRTFDLANDLSLAEASEGNFWFLSTTANKGKSAHKQKGGFTGPQIIKEVCKEFDIDVGGLYNTTWKIPKFVIRRGSPLDVIRAVVLKEWRHKRRRLVVRYDNGKLYVVPLRRSPSLRALGPTLLDAVYKREHLPEFASVVLVHGLPEFAGVDQAHQKMHVERKSQVSLEQFGYVRKILYSPYARTDAELKQEADNYLAGVAKPHRTLTLTSPGIPYLRRGDAIQLGIGGNALRRQIVWVTEISHTLTPAQFISTITVIFDDPYVPNTEMKKVWLLKKTHDEAVGTRQRNNPLGWYLAPDGNNKGDGNQQQQKQQPAFDMTGRAAQAARDQ